jgi:hypothetical protein
MKTIDLIKILLETGDLNKPIKFYSLENSKVGAEVTCLGFRDMHNTIGYVNLELGKVEVTKAAGDKS